MENIEEFEIPEEVVEKLKNPEVIRKHVEDGKTFQEILEFSAEKMEKFYQHAKFLFDQSKYKEASEAFTFLTTLNPLIPNYWIGLGLSELSQEEYHGGLLAFAMAIMSDVANPLPHYYTALCYRALLQPESALLSLDLALMHAGDDEDLHKRATLLKEKIFEEKRKKRESS